MDKVKKVVVKTNSPRTLESILDEALGDLDGMVDGSIKERILGMAKPEEEVYSMEGSDDMEAEVDETGHEEPDGDEIPEDLKAKLMELLAQ